MRRLTPEQIEEMKQSQEDARVRAGGINDSVSHLHKSCPHGCYRRPFWWCGNCLAAVSIRAYDRAVSERDEAIENLRRAYEVWADQSAMPDEKTSDWFRQLIWCGSNSCIYKPKNVGMATNGRCRCRRPGM